MKPAKYYIDTLTALMGALNMESHTVNRVRVIVAPDRNVMGLATALLYMYRIAGRTGRISPKFARAPSQVEFWESLTALLRRDAPNFEALVTFFDEIRGHKYRELWANGFRGKAPGGFFASQLDIEFGDGSEGHAKTEAQRLNERLLAWETPGTYRIGVAGTSPNYLDGRPSECHIAFHREGFPVDLPGPYFAMPMSPAGSGQQADERVVVAAQEIDNDWVVSMTARHLAEHTDDLLLCIPENRGVNLWRMLNESPDQLPAACIQRHHRLADEEWPSVIVVTVAHSWQQYLDRAGR